MNNALLLIVHTATICSLTIFALRFGKELMCGWLALLAVAMNLFVLKQITLFGLKVTSSDALAVGYLLGLNLIQEFFGQKEARRCVWISFFISISFTLLSQIHLAYTPNGDDQTHHHFHQLFSPMPRLVLASLTTFVLVQVADIAFFEFLRQKLQGRALPLRTTCSLLLSQSFDTLFFSFLGLYGLVASIGDVILWSLVVKASIIACTAPFVALVKKFMRHDVQV